MSRSEKLKNWILRAAVVLLCLTVASICATTGLYARYSTGVSFSDSARVARFDIREAGELTQDIQIDGMKPGDTKTFAVQVTSNSEVAVYYTVAVTNVYQNLPLTFAMLDSNGSEIERGTIGANESDTKTYTLRVTWPETKKSPDYAGKVDILTIALRAEQIN